MGWKEPRLEEGWGGLRGKEKWFLGGEWGRERREYIGALLPP